MDTVQKNSVAIVDYHLHTSNGHLVDEAKQLVYLHGYNRLLQGIEDALEGKQRGEKVRQEISPEDAFGVKIDEENLISVHRDQFGQNFERLNLGSAIPIKDKYGADAFLFVQKIISGMKS